jgi:hypothetical protein
LRKYERTSGSNLLCPETFCFAHVLTKIRCVSRGSTKALMGMGHGCLVASRLRDRSCILEKPVFFCKIRFGRVQSDGESARASALFFRGGRILTIPQESLGGQATSGCTVRTVNFERRMVCASDSPIALLDTSNGAHYQ